MNSTTNRQSERGPLESFLSDDHVRLDGLLQVVLADPHRINLEVYAQFRAGLLRHIAMEEKILLPAVQEARRGEPLPIAAKLRLDHGALAALVVPTPTPAIIETIRTILKNHNRLEEGSNGLYATCEKLIGPELEDVMKALKAAPEIKLAPHADGPKVLEATKRALERAGYELKET